MELPEAAPEKSKKEKKDKDKKSKDKKEHKEKKRKDGVELPEAAPEKPGKERKDKDKKKDKKEHKEKKRKADGPSGAAAEADEMDLFGDELFNDEPPKAAEESLFGADILDDMFDTGEKARVELPEAVPEKPGKEKKDKKEKKKDKKEHKEKKQKVELPEAAPEKPGKEKKDKKEKKKDKKEHKEKKRKDGVELPEAAPEKPGKEKKDKKEKKKDKKEHKEKKRKAEGEPGEGPSSAAAAEAAAVGAAASAVDGEVEDGLDSIFKDFADEQEQAEQEQANEMDLFSHELFDDVFSKAFAPEEDDQLGQPPGSVRPDALVPEAELPVVPMAPLVRKKKPARVEAEESQEPQQSLTAKFNEAMEAIKHVKPLAIHEKDSIPYVQGFVQEMIAAAQQDEEDFRQGKPMLNKMQMLPKAVTIMQKYAFMEIFVTYEGCRALALWLKTLPTGELPSVHIRTRLLECMMRLPITKEALQSSKDAALGSVIAKLSSNPKETVANRKMAAMLVQKWLKQVLTKKQESFDLDAFGEEQPVQGTLERPPPETAESLRELEKESATRMHPKIPIISGKEYAVMPMPRAQPVRRERRETGSNRAKLASVLTVMARPNKKSWKPYSPSVAGKNINVA